MRGAGIVLVCAACACEEAERRSSGQTPGSTTQDFLVCLYWFTGPGGGRVDGVLFDLKRRKLGEFFSAAINAQAPATLCCPESAAGPMPSVTVTNWSTRDATAQRGARIRVKRPVVSVSTCGSASPEPACALQLRPLFLPAADTRGRAGVAGPVGAAPAVLRVGDDLDRPLHERAGVVDAVFAA